MLVWRGLGCLSCACGGGDGGDWAAHAAHDRQELGYMHCRWVTHSWEARGMQLRRLKLPVLSRQVSKETGFWAAFAAGDHSGGGARVAGSTWVCALCLIRPLGLCPVWCMDPGCLKVGQPCYKGSYLELHL